jgi:hypothetical protein
MLSPNQISPVGAVIAHVKISEIFVCLTAECPLGLHPLQGRDSGLIPEPAI